MSKDFDIIVIGAGIAGASVAAHLATTHRVAICEMEDRPGYHTTGRSAAMYEPNYGSPPMLALTRAAAAEFWAGGFLEKRDTMFFAPPEQDQQFQRLMGFQKGMREISVAEAKRRFPFLADGYAKWAVLDEHTADIDVDALHQHYLKLFRQNGGEMHCDHAVIALERNGQWTVRTKSETLRARIIVDAAGAWGDVGETWYCKPQSGKLLISPAEATPVDPHDAYADDMTLAEGLARFSEAVNYEVTRVERTWGGLRSFAPDGCPVVGYDGKDDGFFWLIGQGGYGIQSSPALSRLAAALVRGDAPPADIMDEGLVLAEISPERFGAA